jgi:hypothetical protein
MNFVDAAVVEIKTLGQRINGALDWIVQVGAEGTKGIDQREPQECVSLKWLLPLHHMLTLFDNLFLEPDHVWVDRTITAKPLVDRQPNRVHLQNDINH